jgi:phosphoribosylaminoimidazole carboxylase PurK protein
VIGILGGGQLAKMLVEASEKLGIAVAVYTEQADCPAAHAAVFNPAAAASIVVGSPDRARYRAFIEQCTTVIFESEFIDAALLAEAAQGCNVNFLPDLSVMARFQDKLQQKQICAAYGLPTAPWIEVDSNAIDQSIDTIVTTFGGTAVFKWSRLGYDGKGNFFLKDLIAQRRELVTFIEAGIRAGGIVYAEQVIPFVRELAVVCTRGQDGTTITYPVVCSEQQQGICLNVRGPATAFGASADAVQQLEQIAQTIGEKGGIVGTYAVEAFDTGTTVLVNEIAPRVHNTGHYSQDGCAVSQFENHMRAVSGMELQAPKAAPFIGMRNILGPAGINKAAVNPPTGAPGLYLHWYHKQGTRQGRKIGHINFYASTKADFEALCSLAIEVEQTWVQSL